MSDCHTTKVELRARHATIALIGHPNVGKSALFQRLTGQHVAISNYPGTTVELASGSSRALPGFTIVDTPGVITFPPASDDERVTENVLLAGDLKAIVQIGDAKNLARTLNLTIQLAEMGLPLVLALNMMDEAEARGVHLDQAGMSQHLQVPVVPTVAVRGEGLSELVNAVQRSEPTQFRLQYPDEIENAVVDLCVELPDTPISQRAIALLWLSSDAVSDGWLRARLSADQYSKLVSIRERVQLSFFDPLATIVQRSRLDYIDKVIRAVVLDSGTTWQGFSTWLGNLSTHPLWGLVVLGGVLLGLYWIVGVFGAGTLVDLLENRLFGGIVNPWVSSWLIRLALPQLAVDFLIGDYGLWTMGMTYALALILPIVTTFFLVFGILEDSGYLPRLAALSNRLFQALGLNGKAVLPMVLGLGCVTMATLTTRVLESKRERVLVTLLLALAVPCSAQLGVVMGMLAGISFSAVLIWSAVVLAVMLVIGWLAARLMPGERTRLLVELPPLRLPLFSNVVVKTLARLEWYLKEVVPLFLAGAAFMFTLEKTGALAWLVRTGEPLVTGWLRLPPEASAAFLMGFLRRDFGATGLFVLQNQGLLSPQQVVVAMVTITLFIPCIASVMMIAKERNGRTAAGMVALVIPLAFLVGGVLSRILNLAGWRV